MHSTLRFTLLALSILAMLPPAATQVTPAQPVAAHADTNPKIEEEIKSIELNLADQIVRGNWDEYEKHLADDFTHVGDDGKLESRAEVMSAFRTGPRKIIVMEPEDLHVRIYGDTVILHGHITMSLRESGRLSTRYQRVTKVFVNRGGLWYLAMEQSTTSGK